MLCCICKEKEATVHLTQIAGDKMQKVDLCEECAKTKGVNDPTGFSLADLLLGLGASQEIEQAGGGAGAEVPALRVHPGGFQEGRPAGLPGMLPDLCRAAGGLAQDDAQRHAARGQSPRIVAPEPRFVGPAEAAAEEADQSHRGRRFRGGRHPAGRNQANHGSREPTRQRPDRHGPSRLSYPAGRERAAQRAA